MSNLYFSGFDPALYSQPVISDLPSVRNRRLLAGQPLPGDETRLIVSPVRYGPMGAYGSASSPTGEEVAYVQVYGDGRAVFCAQLALTHTDHSWLAYHALRLGIEVLAGETTAEIAESARRAKRWYESFQYKPEEDMENYRITVVPSPFIDMRYWSGE